LPADRHEYSILEGYFVHIKALVYGFEAWYFGAMKGGSMNVKDFEQKKLVDIKTVCDLLGIKRSTAYQWSLAGKLPTHKIGRLNRFRIDEVLKVFGVKDDVFPKS
jgi:excisionase family DNA binding protein